MPSRTSVLSYGACLLTIIALDLVWIGLIAKPLYQQGIGHMMAPQPVISVALAFYGLFAFGLMHFAVLPRLTNTESRATIANAALFGLICYATYDLTNLATLKDWPWGLALVDMAWGCIVSSAAAFAARRVALRALKR